MRTQEFRFAYDHGPITIGARCVDGLEEELERLGRERALIVSGKTVGTTESVIGPVRRGLGDRLSDVYAGTTPARRLDTAIDVADMIRAQDVDIVVGLGGGSSLDIATVASVLGAADRSRTAIIETFRETGTIPLPEELSVPMIAVPTTLAGADLSPGAGIALPRDLSPDKVRVDGGVDDPRLMPAALFADPELVATTPPNVLLASAMNGFDKGIETLYSHRATPFTDATASRGLRILRTSLPALGSGRRDERTMERVVVGNLLVQYGGAQPSGRTMSVIHAFGNGLSKGYDLQQGVAHGIAAPHALKYVFDHVDARRHVLADALGVTTEADSKSVASLVIDAIEAVRDSLDLPAQLRNVPGPRQDEFDVVAESIASNRFMENTPPRLDPTPREMANVLETMW